MDQRLCALRRFLAKQGFKEELTAEFAKDSRSSLRKLRGESDVSRDPRKVRTKKTRGRARAFRISGCYWRLNAGAALCSATIFLAFSARAFAWGRSSRPLMTSGSDSARTFMPSSCPKASTKISDLMFDLIQSLLSINSAWV